MMFSLREYQERIVSDGVDILRDKRLLYLAMEVRTGKTLTSLSIAKGLGAKRVLFVTKKLCIDNGNIVDDYKLMGAEFDLVLSTNNYKTIGKQEGHFDVVIVDEAHTFSSFPKPPANAKAVRKIDCDYMILMSGTPSPESYSQLFHQFWMTGRGPFRKYASFYKRASDYVKVTQKKINGYNINDYSNAKKKKIFEKITEYIISFSQKQSGFSNKITETVHNVRPTPELLTLLKSVKKQDVLRLKDGNVVMDSAATKLTKYRQLCGGSVIMDNGETAILDLSKAEYIRDNFRDKKLLIFYYYQAEKEILKQVLGDLVTEDFQEFRSTNKSIIKQVRNGREGVSYKEADEIVFYSIDYSATSYRQARDRLTTIDRGETLVHWLFMVGGVESKVYKTVLGKKSFTYSHFMRC